MLIPIAKGISMGAVIPFPGDRSRARTSGVRVAYVADHWCVERLVGGVITGRNRMPTRADAERIAARVSRRDKAPLLPVHLSPRVRVDGHYRPDGNAA